MDYYTFCNCIFMPVGESQYWGVEKEIVSIGLFSFFPLMSGQIFRPPCLIYRFSSSQLNFLVQICNPPLLIDIPVYQIGESSWRSSLKKFVQICPNLSKLVFFHEMINGMVNEFHKKYFSSLTQIETCYVLFK